MRSPHARGRVEDPGAGLWRAPRGNEGRLVDLAKTMERDGDVTRNRVARLKLGDREIRKQWRFCALNPSLNASNSDRRQSQNSGVAGPQFEAAADRRVVP